MNFAGRTEGVERMILCFRTVSSSETERRCRCTKICNPKLQVPYASGNLPSGGLGLSLSSSAVAGISVAPWLGISIWASPADKSSNGLITPDTCPKELLVDTQVAR